MAKAPNAQPVAHEGKVVEHIALKIAHIVEVIVIGVVAHLYERVRDAVLQKYQPLVAS
nr:hypothetical protein [Hymenobacter polaris]